MSDTWHEIQGPHGPTAQGFTKPRLVHATPRVPHPACPEHCSGRHTTDGVLVCPSCQVPAYRVVGHEWLYTEGHYWWSLEPMNGSPPLMAPERVHPPCRDCGLTLERRMG